MAEAKDLEITERVEDGVTVLNIIGSVDWSNYLRVDEVFNSLFNRKIFKIVIDMKDTKYISSAGVGSLISAFNVVLENGGRLVFINVSQEIHEVFAILGLNKIFLISESLEDALKSFK
jgi:anti-anti-sigma factor